VESAITYVQCGDLELMLWLHTGENPSKEEWDTHLDDLRRVKARRNGDMNSFRSVVMSDGGAPGSRERSIIFKDLLTGPGMRFAAISAMLSNPVLYGIGTAISWMQPRFKVYSPNQSRQALAYLGVQAHIPAILTAYAELQRTLPPNKTLAAAQQYLAPKSEASP
jgi:hypothetical protein